MKKSLRNKGYFLILLLIIALSVTACGSDDEEPKESVTEAERVESATAESNDSTGGNSADVSVSENVSASSESTSSESTSSGVITSSETMVVEEIEGVTTESGLQYIEVEIGDGPKPKVGDIVQVDYTGKLLDGTIFDTSVGRQPYAFTLGDGQVIPGWDEGVALMNKGGKALLIVPPDLAYGPAGYGTIPPNAMLMFDIQLLDILEGAPAAAAEVSADEYTETDSGLQYYDIEVGQGDSPEEGDILKIHYTGWLEDGSMFDSSLDRGNPLMFKLGQGQVIAGWDEGLSTMKLGGKRQLSIPPKLAYGEEGAGDGIIPSDATLIFDVELLEILKGSPDAPSEIDGEYTETDSGLKYYDFEVGDGDSPKEGDVVSVHYTGWLTDGTKFDSSLDRGMPISFELGRGQVIAGWDEGLSTMKPGGKRQLSIPSELGYGDDGYGGIPPESTLIFEVELVAIQ